MGGRPPTFITESYKSRREFIVNEEVASITGAFLKELITLWEKKYPDDLIGLYIDSIHAKQKTPEVVNSTVDLSGNDKGIQIDNNKNGDLSKMTSEFKPVSIVSPNEDLFYSPETKTTLSPDEIKKIIKTIPLFNNALEPSIDTRKIVSDKSTNNSFENDKPRDINRSDAAPQQPKTQLLAQSKPTGINPGAIPAAKHIHKTIIIPTASFSIPTNARIGEPFQCKVIGKYSNGQGLQILDVTVPQEMGLTFDPVAEELRGIPLVAGEHTLLLEWREHNSASRTKGECLLVVIPDAKSLWKNLEPPKDDPYSKPNEDSALIHTKDFQIVAASTRGRSHAHVGTFRDDDFHISHDDTSGWSLIIVADGAGSAKNSRWGSKLAVEAASHHLFDNLTGEIGNSLNELLANWNTDIANVQKDIYSKFYYLFQEASVAAIKSIETEATVKGSTPKEYSTTLLAAAVKRVGKDTFLATFWMGDGAIAVYGPSGKVRLMGTPDSGEYAGQTRFLDRAALSDQAFSKRITIGLCPDVTSVILMSDGVSDPRFETDNGLLNPLKWDSLWAEISPHLAGNTPEQNLVKWLDFLTPGHHDDRTIALLW